MLRFLSTLVVFAVAASAHAGPGPRVASPDGSIVVTYSAPDLIWASTTALTYGPLVIIEAPAELAELHRDG